MKRHLARAGAWLVAAAIVILSVVPPWLRPVVGPHDVEHGVAFIALGVAFGVSYPGRAAVVSTSLVAFCGLIEAVQLWIPGRHARVEDLVVDILGALLGLAVAALASRPARPPA